MKIFKARAKKVAPPRRPSPKEEPRCARCGRRPSHPHYGGGAVGGVYCNWFCARAMHLATGCGVFRIDAGRNYVEVIAPGRVDLPEEPPSPSVLIERARADAYLEMLLASGMPPTERPAGSKPPPKTTADCVEHIFGHVVGVGPVKLPKTIAADPFDVFPNANLNGAAKR